MYKIIDAFLKLKNLVSFTKVDLKAEVFALHRYFIWSLHMREGYKDTLKQHKKLPDLIFQIRLFLYQSFWFSSLYVVLEGWSKLKLEDEKISELLKNKEYLSLLRRFRNCTFHYQKKYYDKRVQKVFDEGLPFIKWTNEIWNELSKYFLKRIKIRDKDLDRPQEELLQLIIEELNGEKE